MAVKRSTIDILLPLNENYLKSSLAEINDPHTKPLLTAFIDELCTKPLDVLHQCHRPSLVLNPDNSQQCHPCTIQTISVQSHGGSFFADVDQTEGKGYFQSMLALALTYCPAVF